MTDRPAFSVILPTFGRGRHIAPTIQSVLRQSFYNFELIVVGDGCADETEHLVRAIHDSRVTWRNLPRNTGSQSFPNNEGIRAARGSWIAYVGHDDIWAFDHLEAIAAAIGWTSGLDVAVSGCIFHGPAGSGVDYVTGLFDAPEAPLRHFFPPTALAHRRDLTARIGQWADPRRISPPVDAEFLLRAAHAGMRFASTGHITAHKFAAGHRYLSYLRVRSDEQRAMLAALAKPPGIGVDGIVTVAQREGRYMSMTYPDFSTYAPGAMFERNRQNKGISRPATQPLLARTVIEQSDDFRALDWHGLETHRGRPYRWSGPNPRPKILIPYTGTSARLSAQIGAAPPGSDLSTIALLVEDRPVASKIETDSENTTWLRADIPLQASAATVLTLETPMFRPSESGTVDDPRSLGIALADIVLEPV